MLDGLAAKNKILADDRCSISTREQLIEKTLDQWTFEEFFKLTVQEMRNFVKARSIGVTKPWKGTKNKGKADAPLDADTLSRAAFRLRDNKPVADILTLVDLGLKLSRVEGDKTLVQ